jgi:hypothetical protein
VPRAESGAPWSLKNSVSQSPGEVGASCTRPVRKLLQRATAIEREQTWIRSQRQRRERTCANWPAVSLQIATPGFERVGKPHGLEDWNAAASPVPNSAPPT